MPVFQMCAAKGLFYGIDTGSLQARALLRQLLVHTRVITRHQTASPSSSRRNIRIEFAGSGELFRIVNIPNNLDKHATLRTFLGSALNTENLAFSAHSDWSFWCTFLDNKSRALNLKQLVRDFQEPTIYILHDVRVADRKLFREYAYAIAPGTPAYFIPILRYEHHREMVLARCRCRRFKLRTTDINRMPERLFQDIEVVLELLRVCGKHEQGMVTTILQKTKQYFSKTRVVLMMAVQHARHDDNVGFILTYADLKFRNDREFMLAFVRRKSNYFFKASLTLQKDVQFLLQSTAQYRFLMGHVAELRNDRDFMIQAAKWWHQPAQRWDQRIMHFANPTLERDRDFVLAAVTADGSNFFDVRKRWRKDREIALAALSTCGKALLNASIWLRNDRIVVLTAVREFGNALVYASIWLRNDRNVVMTAVQQTGDALKHASALLRNDRKVVSAAVRRQGTALKYASIRLRDDSEIVKLAIRCDCRALEYASKRLRDDWDVVRFVRWSDNNICDWFIFASERLRKEKYL